MKREIKLLQFSNPVFNDGINVTVRHGTKWKDEDRAYVQLGGTHRHGPVILHTRSVEFNKLTDADVMHEHDPSCRTVEGLAAELKRVYPTFVETDVVTLVVFMLRLRTPLVGDMVWLPDMVPYFAGHIEDVIPLNDDFYEIKFGHEKGREYRAVVHAANYLHDVDDENDGWFVVTTY